MFQAVAHFDLNGQLIQTGGAEVADPKVAHGLIQTEINEGGCLGLKPLRGVIVEKRDGAEFCSHIIPIAKQ